MANSTKFLGCLVFLVVMVATHTLIYGVVEGRSEIKEGKEKLVKHKHTVKTIQTKDGDIFDCVDIYKQPALDHPLLRNHKIQMSPGEEIEAMEPGIENTQLMLKTVNCPEKTIPILRTRKSDFHAPTSSNFNPNELDFDPNQTEVALAYAAGDTYTGLDAIISVWNPKVAVLAESSGSFIWAQSNSNSFGGGWMVAPALYGDNNTRFSIFWTNDNFNTGCYNLRCAGFVQTNSDFPIGGIFTPVSRIGDPQAQYSIYLRIFKAKGNGNWWVHVQNTILGYFPSTIFSNMTDMVDKVFWGGKVINTKQQGKHTATKMGSGLFPHDGYTKSSFIRNLRIMDYYYALRAPNSVSVMKTNSYCYDLEVGSESAGTWGTYFYFGGYGSWYQCV